MDDPTAHFQVRHRLRCRKTEFCGVVRTSTKGFAGEPSRDAGQRRINIVSRGNFLRVREGAGNPIELFLQESGNGLGVEDKNSLVTGVCPKNRYQVLFNQIQLAFAIDENTRETVEKNEERHDFFSDRDRHDGDGDVRRFS